MKSSRFQTPEAAIRLLFWGFSLLCLLTALIVPDRSTLFAGLGRICTQSAQTVKSYFTASYGGLSGTFANVGLVCVLCTLVFYLPGARPNGVSVLAFFLTAGLSFWGINLLNCLFFFPGFLLYCLIKKERLGTHVNTLLFCTGIAPLITELLFRFPHSEWHGFSWPGLAFALLAGTAIGLILPAGLLHSPAMHKRYSLFSAAVPLGVIAFFLRAILYKILGGWLPEAESVGCGESYPLLCNLFGIAFFLPCIPLGLYLGGSFRAYRQLLRHSGHSVDYSSEFGVGTAILNLGIYGLFILAYYNAIGASWNAATLGVVFCMVCCAFSGSHPQNVWPILLGYVLMRFSAMGLCALLNTDFSFPLNAQAVVIGLCFANGLSPIAGRYGWYWGLFAGAAHYLLVTSMPNLHAGFLLYNGGLTAGFVCILLVPLLEHFFRAKDEQVIREL